MNSILDKTKRIFFSREFISFVVIGIINTFNGVIFSWIYSSFLNENLAFILGYISGLIISYLLNSLITFREKLELKIFMKFVILSIPNFIIQNIVVIVIFNIMGIHKLIAYILAAAIAVPVTFALMKLFAFKKVN